VVEGTRSASISKVVSAWCSAGQARSRSAADRFLRRCWKSANKVVVGGAGGRTRSVASQIAAKQEFAGYWEYLLDEAIFTHPAHPNWGGTGLISGSGRIDRHRLAAART